MRRPFSFLASLFLSCLLLLDGHPYPLEGAGMPPADRTASEKLFLSAVDAYLADRPWDSLAFLFRAQKKNTYLVDAYLMRALALHRVGRYREAIAAVSAYREVRPGDLVAQTLDTALRTEREDLRRLLSRGGAPLSARPVRVPPHEAMGLPLWRPVTWWGFRGLGKIAQRGDLFLCADQIGGQVYAFSRGGSDRLSLENPAAPCFADDRSLYVFCSDGRIWRGRAEGEEGRVRLRGKVIGRLPLGAVDAEMLQSDLAAVADPMGNRVCRVSLDPPAVRSSWSPEIKPGDRLFEPVALAAWGPYLAVADRGNDRVHLLRTRDFLPLRVLSVSRPRDLAWTPNGDLWILGESGVLTRAVFSGKKVRLNPLAEGLTNAWALASDNREVRLAGVGGRDWWIARLLPERPDLPALFSPADPRIARSGDAGRELRAFGLTGIPYPDLLGEERAVASAAWQDQVITVNLAWWEDRASVPPVAFAPDASDLSASLRRASSLGEILARFRSLSREGKPCESAFLLDTRIAGGAADRMALLALALRRGVRIDLWCRSGPADEGMALLSAATGGRAYFGDTPQVLTPEPRPVLGLSAPLPSAALPPGRLGEALFALFVDLGPYRFRDWMPLWPDSLPPFRDAGR